MSNYKLTTDLIADCIALIPQNLERLNENTNIKFQININGNPVFKRFPEFTIISHCLRTIPEFQNKNLKYKSKAEITHNIWSNWMKYYLSHTFDTNDIKKWSDLTEKQQKSKSDIQKPLTCFGSPYQTIASATLHGQGEFPPSTVEELCESYKNVMKK